MFDARDLEKEVEEEQNKVNDVERSFRHWRDEVTSISNGSGHGREERRYTCLAK